MTTVADPFDVVRCHCGEPLELHCKHGHDPKPYFIAKPDAPVPVELAQIAEREQRASLQRLENYQATEQLALRRSPPRPPATHATGPDIVHRCARCGHAIAPKTGRPPKHCDDCLTPAERRKRDRKNAYNHQRRAEAHR